MANENPVLLGGRYELGHVLGRGGMAEVYLATDKRLHRTVAVKVLRSDLARDDSFQERFRREAQSAAGLNHPAIVAVYDTGEDRRIEAHGHEVSIPYIVMEYVEGRTLRAFIHEDQPMDVRQAAEIMAGVLSALEYSHSKGIVHRDIKPGNIMITEDGAVKVMDFGIARAVADAAGAMTQTQAVMGTAQYLSPEQARGQVVDSRSDIYSAACVLYEMLAGRPPFTGESPVSIAYQHVRETPVPPSTYNPQLSPAMDTVVLRGLTKDREERYPNAVAFSRDIAAVVAGRPPRLVPGTPQPESDGETTTLLAPVGAGATQVLPSGATAAGAGAHAAYGSPTTTITPGSPGYASPSGPPTGMQGPVEPERRKRPVWLFVLVLLALAAIAAALLVYFHPWNTAPDTVAVPDVVGKTESEARSTLTSAGLKPTITQQANDTVAKGQVVSTNPGANKQVAPSSGVTVVVSSGPGSVTLPDLTGKTSDEAKSALEALGLSMTVAGTEDSADFNKGQVTRSDPGANATLNKGDTVQVWTATGNVKVPNVVGQSKKEATSTLQKAGLKVSSTEAESTTADPGTVTSQNPSSSDGNTTAPAGSEVQIVVARQASAVTVPNVAGQTLDQATSQLTQLGLTTQTRQEYSNSVAAGSVIGTDPAANSKVASGGSVTIIVSQGPQAAQQQPSASPTTQPQDPSQSPTPSTTAPSAGTGTGVGGSGSAGGVDWEWGVHRGDRGDG